MFNLYENPWLLLVVGILVLIVGVVIRNEYSPKKGLWISLLGFLIGAGGFGLDYFVQTDYEQIRAAIYTCRDAAIAHRTGPIEPLISEHYKDSLHNNRTVVLAYIEGVFETAAISRVRFQEMNIAFFQGTSQVKLNMMIFLDSQSTYAAAGGLFFVEMTVHFQKEQDDHWRITTAELESVNNSPVNWKMAH